VTEHRGSAMWHGGATALPVDGLLLTVEEVRAATSTTGGQQMGQHGDKAEDGAAQDDTTEERRGQAVEDR
jgi:hypothetical protein